MMGVSKVVELLGPCVRGSDPRCRVSLVVVVVVFSIVVAEVVFI